MDTLWNQGVDEEALLELGPLPHGLTMEWQHLVKPIGSLQAPIVVLSSYPTKDPKSTTNVDFSTVDDMSNVCMFGLYANLGYHKATIRQIELLHIDCFPRCLDRKAFLSSPSVMTKIPMAQEGLGKESRRLAQQGHSPRHDREWPPSEAALPTISGAV
jgi:hypothetical protein